MTAKLRPGQLGAATATTTNVKPSEFANSMAEAMEDELNLLLQQEGKDPFPPNDNTQETRDRRMVFVAIARGIVKHLKAQQDAFQVSSESDHRHDITIDQDV